MKKEKIIGLGILSLALIAGTSTVLAGNFNSEEHRVEMEQQREQMQEVMANGTYEDWVNLHNQNLENNIAEMRNRHQEMLGEITSENWGKFKEAHQLMLTGDRQGAQDIFEELGIERGVGMRSEMGLMHGGKGMGAKGERGQEQSNNN